MSDETQEAANAVTVDLLTREVAFPNPEEMAEQLNQWLKKNQQLDSEYYDLVGNPPEGDIEDVDGIAQCIDRCAEGLASMEYYALVTAPSEAIPHIADAIVLSHGLLGVFDIIKALQAHQQKLSDAARQQYFDAVIHRWLYKFCRWTLEGEQQPAHIASVFEREQKRDALSFNGFETLLNTLSAQYANPTEGYHPQNLQSLYIIFSNLLLSYFQKGDSIPFHLQRCFMAFQKAFGTEPIDMSKLGDDAKQWKLIHSENLQSFFPQFKEIASPIKKAVFLGMLADGERHLIIGQLCEKMVKSLSEMYTFLGKQLDASEKSQVGGREWLVKVYKTITQVAEEQKVVENQEVPEEIRAVFGNPVNIEHLEAEIEAAEAEATPAEAPAETPAAAPAESSEAPPASDEPQTVDIPNLVNAQSWPELEGQGKKNVAIVQDQDVLELIVKNWSIRGSLSFPEMIEFLRTPFQFVQPASPGIRAGRKVISFAYFFALDFDEEVVDQLLGQLVECSQVSEERSQQLKKIYAESMEQMGPLKDMNRDTRKMVSGGGNINPTVFFEKCDTLRTMMMEKYPYLESLISYWNMAEDIFYSIARGVAGMAEVTDPKPDAIEKFVKDRNDEFMNSYEKAVSAPECKILKSFFNKKYDAELKVQFINVKIKNDLITMANTTPVNLRR